MVGHFIQTQQMATTVNPITPLSGNYMKGSHGLMHLGTRDKLRDLLVTIGVRGRSPVKNAFPYGGQTGKAGVMEFLRKWLPRALWNIWYVQPNEHLQKYLIGFYHNAMGAADI